MTVLERLKELGERHEHAKRVADVNMHDIGNQVSITGQVFFCAMRDALPHLIAVAEAAKNALDLDHDYKKARTITKDSDRDRETGRIAHNMQLNKHFLITALAELTNGAGDER